MRKPPIALAVFLVAGCGAPSTEELGKLESPLTSRSIFSDSGRIVAAEVSDCFTSFSGGGQVVSQSGAWAAPAGIDDATIIFNGFEASYLSGDRHLQHLEAQIRSVVFGSDRVLRWTFQGTLQDASTSGQEVCYHATVVGWNRTAIAARTHRDYAGVNADYDGFTAAMTGYGVLSSSNVPADCPFVSGETVAVMPRGVGFHYIGADHHVLQLGYHQSQDTNPGTCVNWTTRAVLKDNNADDFTSLRGRSSLLGGRDVRIASGSFSLSARSGTGGCVTVTGGEKIEHIRQTVSYDYAIPMLTGWELYYPCDDQHVATVGASVRNIRFDRATRVLEYDYVTVLADRNAQPFHNTRRQISILGVNNYVPVFTMK